MSKLKLKQNYQELSDKFFSEHEGKELYELDEQATLLYIEFLKAKLAFKEATIDEFSFNRYHKPVILHKIMRAESHLENRKFFKAREVTA